MAPLNNQNSSPVVDSAAKSQSGTCRVGAVGTYGGGNLGDEAIFVAFLEWARRCKPSVEPVALCVNPQYVRGAHDVEAFAVARVHTPPVNSPEPTTRDPRNAPLHTAATTPGALASPVRKAPWRWLRRRLHWARVLVQHLGDATDLIAYFPTQLLIIGSLDAVVLLGGGQIQDFWDGSLGHPATLFFWALACKLRRKSLVVLSMGGVRLRKRLSRWFIRRVLEWSRYVSFRDGDTAKIVRSLGFRRDCPLAPDLAWGLATDELLKAADSRPPLTVADSSARPTVVGVSPMVYRHPTMWPRGNAADYSHYVDKLAAFCARLASKGYDVVLFPSQIRADRVAIDDVVARMDAESRTRIEVRSVRDVPELLRCLAQVDVVVASRFHGVVLSLLVGRPVLSLSYQRKNDQVLAEIGEQRFALDIHSFSLADLEQSFDALCEHDRDYRERLGAHARRQSTCIDAQYRQVFGEVTRATQGRAAHDDLALPQ